MDKMINELQETENTKTTVPETTPKKKKIKNILLMAKDFPGNAWRRFKDADRKTVKKYVTVTLIVAILACTAVVGIQMLTNNYMTPIKTREKYANKDEYSAEKAYLKYSNGLVLKEWKQIFKIMHNSDAYLDIMEEVEEVVIKKYESNLDKYGDDYKIKYEVVGKLELEKSELRDYRSDIQAYVDMYEELADEAEDFSSEDWADVAEEMDLRKSEAKELAAEFRNLAEKMGRVRVDKGYELEIKQTITGSELEEPEENNVTIVVLKVNGRWISYIDYVQIFKSVI